jgi:outer membrane protein insertion porin family
MNKTLTRNSFKSIFFLMLFAWAISPSCLQAQDIEKVAIFPFEVHAPTDAAALRDRVSTVIAKELQRSKAIQIIHPEAFMDRIRGKQIDEQLASSVGKNIGADYVVIGSLSQLGKSLSLDTRIINVKAGKTLPAIYAQGTGIDSLGLISTQLAKEITAAIAGKQVIAKINLSGNRRIENSAVLNVLKSSKGKLFSDADLTSDIKAVYKMGYFDDVKADVTDSPEGKIVTFILEERPLITDIQITGNHTVTNDDIKTSMTVKTKQVLNPDRLRSDAEKIKALCDDKGCYNAEITYEIKQKGDREVQVVFHINEGDRLYIKSIEFVGNNAFSAKELKNMLDVTERGMFSFITDSGVLKEDKLKESLNKIKVFYLNNGYIQAQIGDPGITHDKKWIYVKISINEGKQFKVGKIDIAGDTVSIPRKELLENLMIAKKVYYDREAIMKDMEYLTRMAHNDGYAYADVTPRTNVQEKEQRVDVTYDLKKGSQVFFNRINIAGNTKTRDKVIRRELAVAEGDLFSSDKLKTSYQKLSWLQFFEEINFQTEKGPEENLTDFNIKIKEKPTGQFSIGGGYSAQDNFVFMGQISQQNLFGRGQELKLAASLGGSMNSIDLSFTDPWFLDMPLWSKFDLWRLYREYDTYNLYTMGIGATFGHHIWERIMGYIGYRLKKDNIEDIQDSASQIIKDQVGNTVSSSLTLTLSRDTTDDRMYPTKGSKNSFSVDYYGRFLGGDTAFIRYTPSTSWYYSILDWLVFSAHGRMGYISGNEGREVPVFERFILGGINSLRGLRNVGPHDPATNDTIGGFTMMNFNFEIVFPIIKDAGIRGVLFNDWGNAWNSGYHFDDLRRTVGVGIRWYSPMGPLRFEWGHVLDQRSGEDSSRFEFTIGMFMQ